MELGHYLKLQKKIKQYYMVLWYMMYQEDILYHTSLYLMWNTQGECLKAQVIQLS